MERSEFNEVVSSLHSDAKRRGLFFQHCEDEHFAPNQITLQGQRLLSFGSCSYLGLEHHPMLKRGVINAVERFGTQFSSSRGYLSCPLYQELEENLSEIFGGHVLCMPTTTLAHLAAFDVLITEKDALVLDHHVHASVQKAAHIARGSGARVEFVKHGELERSVELVKQLSQKHRTVWFTTDGITSMYGSLAPLDLLQALLDAAPNVRIYIDDAHGMSWAGKHGRGSFLSRMPLTDRIVIATSQAKAFGTGGGILAFTDKDEMERVRMCGGTAIFSGPIQPPMLGASLASSRVHLSDEIYERQRRLQENISFANQRMIEAKLPLLLENEAPISFVGMGLPRIAHEVAARVKGDGIYLNVSTFPTVPMKRAGLRIALNVNHSKEDISRMVDSIAENLARVLSQEGIEREQLEALFEGAVMPQQGQRILLGAKKMIQPRLLRRRSAFLDFLDANNNSAPRRESEWPRTGVDIDPALLSVQYERSIHKIDKTTWDQALAGAGCISWEAMAVAERVFQGQERPEHNWRFHYILVRDQAGSLVAATSFTTMLQKDDMLMREKVSQAVEALRKDDPYFLTSRALTMGSGISEGNHLFLDRAGPWRAGLLRLLEVADQLYESEHADILALRDLPGDDPEMDAFLLEQGLIKVPNFDSHVLELTKSEVEIFSGLNRSRRQEVQEITAKSTSFYTIIHSQQQNQLHEKELAYLHSLYRNIATQKVRLNTFELPPSLLPELLRSSAWEVGALHLSAEAGGPSTPVAFWAAHRSVCDYAPLIAGLDYNYVRSHGAYRQMILAVTRRARELGAARLHMGMDAEVEKRRFGAIGKKTCLYLQARGDYNASILQKIVAEVELATKQKSA